MTITIESFDLTKLKIISKLKSITNLELIFKVPINITNDNLYFIKEMDNLRSLSLNANYIEPDFFKDMSNLEELCLSSGYDINYQSLNNIKKIKFNDGPYTISKYLSKDDIMILRDRNIRLSSDSYSEKDFFDKIIYIHKKIDDIIKNIDITDIDKNETVKRIITYILDNYKDDVIDEEIYNTKFKNEGELYFSLENEFKTSSSYISLMRIIFEKLNIENIKYNDICKIVLIKELVPQKNKRYKIKIDNRIWIINEEMLKSILLVFNGKHDIKQEKKHRRIYEFNNR